VEKIAKLINYPFVIADGIASGVLNPAISKHLENAL
jgi:hypothetical protein